MQRPPVFKKKDVPQQISESTKANIYLLGSILGVCALLGVGIYHFFFSATVIEDKIVNSGNQGGKGVFSFFGRSVFSKKPPLELSNEEMDALGISAENRKAFDGATAENFREKRRLMALEKYEGSRRAAEERNKALVDLVTQRNNSPQELKDAVESIDQSDNLALMRLESFVANEMANRNNVVPTQNRNDSLTFALQCLTDIYIKKNMRDKAKDTYLQYLKVSKEKAPEGQGQLLDQAIGEFESADATTSGS